MTDKQRRTLDNIREFIAQHGRAPTVRELMAIERVSSTSAVTQRLTALVRYGHLRKTSDLSGRYVIADEDAEHRLRTYSTEDLKAELTRRAELGLRA